jgi:hypothetical protein
MTVTGGEEGHIREAAMPMWRDKLRERDYYVKLRRALETKALTYGIHMSL